MGTVYYIRNGEKMDKYTSIEEVVSSFFIELKDDKYQRVMLLKIVKLWMEIFGIDTVGIGSEKEKIFDKAKENDEDLIELINYSELKKIITVVE